MSSLYTVPADFGRKWEHSAVDTLEHLIQQDVGDVKRGQNLDRFYDKTRGNLLEAANSIVPTQEEKPVIRILTGFYIEKAGAAETDGILAAAQMTYFFKLAGIDCCIATDQYCEAVCRAALAEVDCLDRLEVIQDTKVRSTSDYIRDWTERGVTHAIAIERPGPSLSDDLSYNMNGEVLTHHVPLYQLFNGGNWRTIGVIDRGNEIGSGSLPGHVIAEDIRNGGKIACRIGSDDLIVSRVSNWAANALTAAVAMLGPVDWPAHLNRALAPGLLAKILKRMVRAGAVDGITFAHNVAQPTIDALPLESHTKIAESLLEAVEIAVRGRNLLQETQGPKTPERTPRSPSSAGSRMEAVA
jgi:hypothetical protein